MNSKVSRVEEGEELEDVRKFAHYKDGAVKIQPGDILLPIAYENEAQNLLNFKLRPTDVFIVGFPRSGTTWAIEIIWNMTNNADFSNKLKEETTSSKGPYLELPFFPEFEKLILDTHLKSLPTEMRQAENYNYWNFLEDVPSPRIIKTHLQPKLINPDLLETSKVVYIMRDPKDVILSLFYLSKSMPMFNFKGDLEEFADLFMKGRVLYGSMPELAKSWWHHRNHKNVYFMFYEDLRTDTYNEMKKLNEFLGANLTEEQLVKIEDYCNIKKMKARDKLLENKDDRGSVYNEKFEDYGGILRKGLVGESKEVFSIDLHKKVEKYLKEAFEGIDLPYDYLKN